MRKKIRLILSHIITISALLGVGSFSQAATRPAKSASVKKITRAQDLRVVRTLRAAEFSAQRADEVTLKLQQINAMGRFERWTSGVNTENIQAEYCHYMTDHVKAMTVLFKKRQIQKKFHGYREFEYSNLLRRSDYLLTSTMTKNVLESLSEDSEFHGAFLRAIEDYNLARQAYDGKALHFE